MRHAGPQTGRRSGRSGVPTAVRGRSRTRRKGDWTLGGDARHNPGAAARALRAGLGSLMLKSIFTWWNGATIGAAFDIGRRAQLVGRDEQGNRYFEERKPSLDNRKRRYVIYKGLAEPSRVPPDWHGWLHHTFDKPPTDAPLPRKSWEKEHKPNLTGTLQAYRPKGSLASDAERRKAAGDYEAWKPDA
jgi:NADH:ubiquinone oxidoreductase subunit